MTEYKTYWSKTTDIFSLDAQHFICALDSIEFGLYASALTSNSYAITAGRIEPTSWLLRTPGMDIIADVKKPEPLVRTENMLLRFVPKRGNFQNRVEPINLRLKEKLDGVDEDSLGEGTVISVATDGTSTLVVAEINNKNRLFISRTFQGDLEELDLNFTPRTVLYGQSTDARTHYTENITYDDINKSAGFSDPIPDAAEWNKVQGYVILEKYYEPGTNKDDPQQSWKDRIHIFHAGADKTKDSVKRIDEEIFGIDHS